MLHFSGIAALCAACVTVCSADWELFKSTYGKQYSPEEEVMRRAIYERHLRQVQAHNLLYDAGLSTYQQAINRFSDLTGEEYAQRKGLRFNANRARLRLFLQSWRRLKHGVMAAPLLPKTVDWRSKGYVTPVKDQGMCGSCWAFSSTGALEGQHFRKTGKLVSLSEQNLVDCSNAEGNFGCSGGFMDQAFEYVRRNHGIDTEKSYSYKGIDERCHFKRNSIGATCRGYVDIDAGSEEALQRALATVGPVSVAIDASHESFQHYKSGVYDEPYCSSFNLDHGVLAVGYGTLNGTDYWLIKNSWGKSWGDSGYIYMVRNKHNQCGVATSASYPLV